MKAPGEITLRHTLFSPGHRRLATPAVTSSPPCLPFKVEGQVSLQHPYNQPMALGFCPRVEWPEAFRFYRLY